MTIRSDLARDPDNPRPTGRGSNMISRAALSDIDEEILEEYLESTLRIEETDLLRFEHIEGGIRHIRLPDLDEQDREGPGVETCIYYPRRKYAERI